jgi:hypothetical protein
MFAFGLFLQVIVSDNFNNSATEANLSSATQFLRIKDMKDVSIIFRTSFVHQTSLMSAFSTKLLVIGLVSDRPINMPNSSNHPSMGIITNVITDPKCCDLKPDQQNKDGCQEFNQRFTEFLLSVHKTPSVLPR